MTTKIKYWAKLKDHNKEVVIDVKKLGYTEEEWAVLDVDLQDEAVIKIPDIMVDWGVWCC